MAGCSTNPLSIRLRLALTKSEGEPLNVSIIARVRFCCRACCSSAQRSCLPPKGHPPHPHLLLLHAPARDLPRPTLGRSRRIAPPCRRMRPLRERPAQDAFELGEGERQFVLAAAGQIGDERLVGRKPEMVCHGGPLRVPTVWSLCFGDIGTLIGRLAVVLLVGAGAEGALRRPDRKTVHGLSPILAAEGLEHPLALASLAAELAQAGEGAGLQPQEFVHFLLELVSMDQSW